MSYKRFKLPIAKLFTCAFFSNHCVLSHLLRMIACLAVWFASCLPLNFYCLLMFY